VCNHDVKRAIPEDFHMSIIIQAIYENGVFRPIERVEIPEKAKVELEVRIGQESTSPSPVSAGLARIYAILGERYETGERDLAARVDEHQP
jgi:predicted DNA-binding antitoxin AbrB/MazE fold protein